MISTITKSSSRALLLFALIGLASAGFTLNPQQKLAKLKSIEKKVNTLEALIDQAIITQSALAYELSTNGSPAVVDNLCKDLQQTVKKFDAPLNVMNNLAGQLANAEITMGVNALTSFAQTADNCTDVGTTAIRSGTSSASSFASVAFNLSEMARVLEDCVRREVQDEILNI